MGTWGMGHFDSDTAADFAGNLDDAPADKRESVIREALTIVVRTGPKEYLDADDAVVAVAASALLAAQRPGGAPVDTAYGPDEPLPRFAPDLGPLAALALDRVVAAESELLELWADVGEDQQWRAGVLALREILAGEAARAGAQDAG
ncbi:DUF4259 domain-containing protein [Streptomyces sp. NBC_01102]|uniref:DUF4259 domain-containing protein n=1 Tax=unclassified Streptomyces TaxID=2593676 RepID=UPI0038670C1F|nr:DUF4259 domain-containing protein [Streptomyces sp. NBC_01102]